MYVKLRSCESLLADRLGLDAITFESQGSQVLGYLLKIRSSGQAGSHNHVTAGPAETVKESIPHGRARRS